MPEPLTPGAEYHLKIRFVLSADTSWAPKGHEVAWDQFRVPFPVPPKVAVAVADMPELKMTTTAGGVVLQGTGFEVVFGRAEGTITRYEARGQELVVEGPRENYYRAPTDIDLLMGNPPANVHKWRAAGLDRLVRTVMAFEAQQISGQVVEIRVQSHLCAEDKSEGIDSEVVYRVYGNGEVALNNKVLVDERLPFLPRIGLELALSDELEQIAWYGRGPHENYVDRKRGAAVGLYRSTVGEQFTPYVYPSECGGKEDVRWVALTNQDGDGLMVIGLDSLHVDALWYTIQDLAAAGHPHELTRQDKVILHLDGWHMGVGGDDGWYSQVHDEFLIQPGKYRYSLRLRPVSGQEDPSVVGRTMIEGMF
jgi:beta-galactosidase